VLAESVSADCRVSHAGRPVTSSTPTASHVESRRANGVSQMQKNASMTDIQSETAEIRRGKERKKARKKERRRRNHRMKI